MAGLQNAAEAVKVPSLHERIDAFVWFWGDQWNWASGVDSRRQMTLDLLLIVAAAKREEAEERGVAMNRIIDEAFRSET